MAKLEFIEIKNVKGISSKLFDLQLFPNKPCILVAPNGFGKSSLACAFKSLNNNRIDLAESNHYQKDVTKKPELTVRYDGVDYKATDTVNAISKIFDVSVINSHLVPDAKKRKIGGFTTVSTSLKVSSVVLIDNIPKRKKFSYKYSDMKASFGVNGKILPTALHLFDDLDFIGLLDRRVVFSEFTKVRTYKKLIPPILASINGMAGTAVQVKNAVNIGLLVKFREIEPLNSLATLIAEFDGCSELDSYLYAWQVVAESQTAGFKSAMQYHLYLGEKKFFDELIASADTTRHKVSTKEKKAGGTKRQLVVDFPSVDEMSNGQRDILSFMAQAQLSIKKLKKPNCILVIDEIFDYLDDANLVAFQYYITQMIEGFKSQDRNVFPLLLTHLDPGYFKHFCFNKHRLQIKYLNRNPALASSVFLKLVKNRSDAAIEDELSKYHFHYHPLEKDLEADFMRLSMRKVWGRSHSFYNVIYREVNSYLNGTAFDPIAILFAVRIKIEELAYGRLVSDIQREEFLDGQHGTSNKLGYCESVGISIPETYYLLGLIYNDNLHWNDKRDYETPLLAKLENFTIKKMISEVFV